MVSMIDIENGKLRFTLTGVDKVLALKSELKVPLTHVKSVMKDLERIRQKKKTEQPSKIHPQAMYTWTTTSPPTHPRGTQKIDSMLYPRSGGAHTHKFMNDNSSIFSAHGVSFQVGTKASSRTLTLATRSAVRLIVLLVSGSIPKMEGVPPLLP